MADSLFDNRYRYDYIYPRGRSGETLRAVDTANHQLEVVIKRPAPNDAPPIRAGQEVSINNERRALQRLAGHPVLTELLGDGQFFVGGMPHQYIVMERATGTIIGDDVLALAATGERLPELEMLVIVDALLDLLHAAHSKDIVYNDVDAKHLFWQRDHYMLKVIDWGNAVFLEGDDVTPQGISRQTDIYQVGELLYFILTGGRRADVPRDSGDDFVMDFGEDARRVSSQLQAIVSKALHPNTRQRYASIAALRADLTQVRQPLERERNLTVTNVSEKLQRNGGHTMSELRALRTTLEPALAQDPGYPLARETFEQIDDLLRDLSVEADLDAVQIYLKNGNWSRAADLLDELLSSAGSQTGSLINLLLDMCAILIERQIDSAPDAVTRALEQLYNGQHTAAAMTLMEDTPDDSERVLYWQLAERISSHMPEVLLLRPNLFRLGNALRQFANEGYRVNEPRALLAEVDNTLDHIADGTLNLPYLRDGYRAVVDQLSKLNPLLQTFAAQHQLSTRRAPLNALERALNAAMALADNMHVIGKQAASSPRDALHALEISRSIDPANPVWSDLQDFLDRLYNRLQSSQTYVPAADGSDLQDWLSTTRDKLRPFQERVFDDMLANMVRGTERALQAWINYQDMVLQGNREQVVASLEQASNAVSIISPALSQWFGQLRSVVAGANYIERHALPGGLGRALADGWGAFDRGRLSESERLGQQAYETARSEAGRVAAARLKSISRLLREWVERNGVASAERTRELLNEVENLFTERELQIRQDFEAQMPTIETYLKAMSRGLVTDFASTSTAGLRLLFVYYIAQGTLDVHEGRLDDGEFWREAASKTLSETGERHIATRTLAEYITSRQDMLAAAALLRRVNGRQIIPDLADLRRQLENNAQARTLTPAIQGLRDIETALRDWSDGDFRAAGLKLEDAHRGFTDTSNNARIDTGGAQSWVMDLMETAAQLTVIAREQRRMIEERPDEPPVDLLRTFNEQVNLTESVLGTNQAASLRQQRDTYVSFVNRLTADERRSRRLEKLNELFRALFIDQHPAYPLFQHWYALLEAEPEFAAPPTDDPIPQEESASVPETDYRPEAPITPDVTPPRSLGWSMRLMIGGTITVLTLVVVLIGFWLFGGDPSDPSEPPLALTFPTEVQAASADDTITPQTQATSLTVVDATDSPTRTIAPTRINTVTAIPTATNERGIVLVTTVPPSATPTQTPVIPTDTPTATETPTPSITPTIPQPTRTPLPPNGVRGNQDLLALFNRTPDLPFNPDIFFPVEGGYRLGSGASQSAEDTIRIVPPLAFFEDSFGGNAASRITSVEADLVLPTFNPTLLDDEQGVYFGLTLESASDGNNIGIQVDVLNSNSIRIQEVVNNQLNSLRTRSVSALVVRLRIDRDLQTGEVLLFVNDEQIQTAQPFMASDAQILPVVYVREGGVILRVTDWRITLG